jgi:hypothetical protein
MRLFLGRRGFRFAPKMVCRNESCPDAEHARLSPLYVELGDSVGLACAP